MVGGRRRARFATTTASRCSFAWGFHVMVRACKRAAAVPRAVLCRSDGLYNEPVRHLHGTPSLFCCAVHLLGCLFPTLSGLVRATQPPTNCCVHCCVKDMLPLVTLMPLADRGMRTPANTSRNRIMRRAQLGSQHPHESFIPT